MVAFGATATRVVTASCPLCSNSDGWLDDHYGGAKPPLNALIAMPEKAGLCYLKEIVQRRSWSEKHPEIMPAGSCNCLGCLSRLAESDPSGRTAETEPVGSGGRRIDHVHIDFGQFHPPLKGYARLVEEVAICGIDASCNRHVCADADAARQHGAEIFGLSVERGVSDRICPEALDNRRRHGKDDIAAVKLDMLRPDAERQSLADNAVARRHGQRAVWP